MTLYELKNNNFLSQNDFYNLLKEHFRCGYLQKHTFIHAIKQALKDVKSFYELMKKYDKRPNRSQKPGFPHFKHEKRLIVPTFMKTAVRIRNNQLLLSIGKKMKADKKLKCITIDLPQEVYDFVSEKNVKMVTVMHIKCNRYEIKFVYEVQEKPYKVSGDIMSIDLGVSNLAAITFLESTSQYLLNGNVIKSKIATYNKRVSIAQSKHMLCTGSHNFKLTKKLKRLMTKRNNIVNFYIHNASKKIVDIAEEHDVKIIVIGDMTYIKSENKQKYFVQIPHSRLRDQIIYKSKLRGIKVILQEESYTSSVSSLDLESVDKSSADKSRRVVRGLFKTSYGYMNSDINGSLNILRKHVGEKNIPKLISIVRDKGIRENPIRLEIV
jgi:IS605 OrfB family transposase